MAEISFKSPGYFDREIDQSAPAVKGPVGTPAGVVGTTLRGPAFVPVTVASFDEFVSVFGSLDPKKFGPYAVNEFLKHRSALTYLRVLGAGANTTDAHVSTTSTAGRVQNAGFKIEGAAAAHDSRGRHVGAVQFLAAQHTLSAQEAIGMPLFTDNNSYAGSTVRLIHGIVMLASGARMMVLNGDENSTGLFVGAGPDDAATFSSGKFKLVISSTLGNEFYNSDSAPGVKIMTASFDPSNVDYFGKIMNTDPDKFVSEQHLLYAMFPVDAELVTASVVAVMSGSTVDSDTSGETTTTMRAAFGAYDTRYTMPHTSNFISQPFGATEHDLFSFEALDDGAHANELFKISITNLRMSTDPAQPYGTFNVAIRDFNDTDLNPRALETFPNCSLDPSAKNYVARLIGDRRVTYNFDSSNPDERRIITSGKYSNVSKYVRIVVTDAVERKHVPARSLPFGFRGHELLRTNDSLNDTAPANPRLAGVFLTHAHTAMSGAILPPVPFRFKVTRGDVSTAGSWQGQPGVTESVSPLLHWGVKFERNTDPLNANISSEPNKLISGFTKFMGIRKLDTLVTGSGADTLNENKFTLARVAFSNLAIADLTASVNDHMKEAAYIRDGVVDKSDYTVSNTLGNRITLATLVAQTGSADFNKFSSFAKFTTFMYGGFDGLNVLDGDARRMNDKSTSFDASGGAEANYVSPGFTTNLNGAGQNNSNVASYKTAIDIMTDPMTVNVNVLAVPGIRESFLTDHAMKQTRDYGMAFYVMDIPSYDDAALRLYDDSVERPDVDQTAIALDTRAVDNNYAGTYFPNVTIEDVPNNRRVKVPASVAVMGALAFNDRIAYPWYSPAGFNRAALDFVKNVEVRLNVSDRDRLYDESRINPIATFPRLGFVIYGQKTLQNKKSALDRVNVRRMLLEVKRIVVDIAKRMTFEQNTPAVRNKFVADVAPRLSLIQAQQGIERFSVICNETNNSAEDIDLNRIKGRVVLVPTRTAEFVSVTFVITNSGIEFV